MKRNFEYKIDLREEVFVLDKNNETPYVCRKTKDTNDIEEGPPFPCDEKKPTP